MNTWLEYAILGVVQGVAEFLPISSDGHLLLAQSYLGVKEPQLFVTIMLHVGTLLATALFFFGRIKTTLQSKQAAPLLKSLFIAMIPTGIVAVLIKKGMEEKHMFTPELTAALLMVNGLILFVAHTLQKKHAAEAASFVDGQTPKHLPSPANSALIGFLQGIAALPGVSRSGCTLMGGMFSKLGAKEAFEYSFLLSLPAVGAAIVFEMKDFNGFPTEAMGPLVFGVLLSFVVGYVSLSLLQKVVTGGKLYLFGIYCIVIGGINGLYLLMHGGAHGG